MTQIVLDPTFVGSPVGEISIPVLPDRVRSFGFVPNIRKCLPGDLILYREVQPTKTGIWITSIQKKAGFGEADSSWSHAALFLYDSFIVEAVPKKGVVQRNLYSDSHEQVIRVRRRLELSEIDRHRIALRALSMIGARYSHAGVLALGWSMLQGFWSRPGYPNDRNIVICSEVFHDAYTEITRNLLAGCPVNIPITPAHLSATPDLVDIELGWLKVI